LTFCKISPYWALISLTHFWLSLNRLVKEVLGLILNLKGWVKAYDLIPTRHERWVAWLGQGGEVGWSD